MSGDDTYRFELSTCVGVIASAAGESNGYRGGDAGYGGCHVIELGVDGGGHIDLVADGFMKIGETHLQRGRTVLSADGANRVRLVVRGDWELWALTLAALSWVAAILHVHDDKRRREVIEHLMHAVSEAGSRRKALLTQVGQLAADMRVWAAEIERAVGYMQGQDDAFEDIAGEVDL